MKKRMLSALLALGLCLGMLPMAALAEENSPPHDVYQGDGYYITVEKYGNQENLSGFWGGSYFSDGLIYDQSSKSFLDKDGNVVLSGEALKADDIVLPYGTHFSDGLCTFRDDKVSGYGYIDKTGKIVLEPSYNYDYTPFHDGLALVRNAIGRYDSRRYIDKSGNTVLTVNADLSALTNFDGGHAVCSDSEIVDGKVYNFFPIIDRSGRVTATYSPRLADGSHAFVNTRCFFSEGYGVVAAMAYSYCLHVFDADGNLVWRMEEPLPGSNYYCAQLYNNVDLSGVHGGILVYSIGRSEGMDCMAVEIPSGRSIFPERKTYTYIYDNFSDGIATFKDDDRGYGLVDSNGFEVVAPGEFDAITPFNEGLAIARRGYKEAFLLEKHEGTWSGAQQQPTEQPTGGTAYASTQNVLVDGSAVEFQCYALKDANGNDTNYVKLRDVAQVLNGTAVQFEVGWDGSVNIETGKAYTSNGSEMKTPFSGNRAYSHPDSPTNVNGQTADLDAIVLLDDNGGAYTYYKLRDLGTALNFKVDWNAEKGIFIETK